MLTLITSTLIRYCCIIGLAVLVLAASANAQVPVQWASKVLGFSSEFQDPRTPRQYGAEQILGKPNKLPAIGSSPCAWMPSQESNPGAEEWIKVGYSEPMRIRQVAIAENLNAGSVSRIYAYDEQNREYLLFENTKDTTRTPGRIMNVMVPETAYRVTALKLVLKTSRIKGWNQIDAIGISSATEPVEATINVIPNATAKVRRENLGRSINSQYDEICPVISPDGKTLYFTRAMHPGNTGNPENQDVWYAEIDNNGQFKPAKNMGPPVNTPQHNSSFSITPDGNTMLLNNKYMPDGRLYKGLSMTHRTENSWSFPEPVNISKYYNDNDYAEFTLAQNGRVLIMTAQRKDSYGSKDLYVSFLQAGNTWSEPKNMGPVVNTADDETSPFIASDGVSLYYSTGGLSGYGNKDVFVSKRLDDTWLNWTEPQNLGPAINTDAWDAYYTIPASGEYAYFVSDKESLGENDIFRVKLDKSAQPDPVVLVHGRIFNAETKQPIVGEITYASVAKSSEGGKATANPASSGYKVVLPLKQKYTFTAHAKGYMPAEESLDLSLDTAYREIRQDLYLVPIAEGQVVRLNNIFFEQSQYELLEASFTELNRVAELMKENPEMEIRLEGHTDNIGDFMLNVELSKNRVLTVKEYLVNQGIDANRIQFKAYGGTQPIASNANEDSRKQNRRVEFVILRK
jgi:outer membrane protein OmpA-like peptidoglycan-associated protein